MATGLSDEIYLAKLIQNAKARKLVGCTGSYYQSSGDEGFKAEHSLPVEVGRKLVACCADGAARLESDTKQSPYTMGLANGNDDPDWISGHNNCATAENIGWAFRQAMK
jgi:hypothetical protein